MPSSPPSVTTALTAAEALFNAQGVGDTTLTTAERRTALALLPALLISTIDMESLQKSPLQGALMEIGKSKTNIWPDGID